jgi:anti-anti-sigma factor
VTTATVTPLGTVDGVCTLAVAGEVDLANAAEVEDRILDHTANDLVGVVLDLDGLDYLDSTGLRLLFTLAARLEISQIDLELVVTPGSPVRRALEITGLSRMVSLRPPGEPGPS